MKKTNDNSSIRCDEVERLLIKKDVDGLTPEENLLLEDHLKSCERCRSYQNALLNVQNSIQMDSEEKLIPDPAIRQNIIQRMKTLRPEQTGIFKSGWQYIRNMLEYRIPVYQTLLGIVLILLISFSINTLFLTTEKESSKLPGFAQMEPLVSSQMGVLDNLEIIDQQKIGISAKEDTSLTRFLVTIE
jgi:hypothetical protein